MTATGPTGADASIDRVNLEQALLDFEVANARVIDLASRVTNLSTEVVQLRADLGQWKLRCAQAETNVDNLTAALQAAQVPPPAAPLPASIPVRGYRKLRRMASRLRNV